MRTEPTVIKLRQDPQAATTGQELVNFDDAQIAPAGISYGYTPHDVQEGPQPVGRLDAENVVFETNVGTEVRVAHNLGRIPRRWVLVAHNNTGAQPLIFKGTSAWTDKEVFFDSDTSGDVVTVEIA